MSNRAYKIMPGTKKAPGKPIKVKLLELKIVTDTENLQMFTLLFSYLSSYSMEQFDMLKIVLYKSCCAINFFSACAE